MAWEPEVRSDVDGVVLSGGQFFPAGGASVRAGQRVPDALAAEDVAALGGNHQPAGVHDLCV